MVGLNVGYNVGDNVGYAIRGSFAGFRVGRGVGLDVRTVMSVGGANTALVTETLAKGFVHISPHWLAFSLRSVVQKAISHNDET